MRCVSLKARRRGGQAKASTVCVGGGVGGGGWEWGGGMVGKQGQPCRKVNHSSWHPCGCPYPCCPPKTGQVHHCEGPAGPAGGSSLSPCTHLRVEFLIFTSHPWLQPSELLIRAQAFPILTEGQFLVNIFNLFPPPWNPWVVCCQSSTQIWNFLVLQLNSLPHIT